MTKDFLREDSKMLEYISAPEAAKKWGISERRVQKLCEENRIPGVAKFSRMWFHEFRRWLYSLPMPENQRIRLQHDGQTRR